MKRHAMAKNRHAIDSSQEAEIGAVSEHDETTRSIARRRFDREIDTFARDRASRLPRRINHADGRRFAMANRHMRRRNTRSATSRARRDGLVERGQQRVAQRACDETDRRPTLEDCLDDVVPHVARKLAQTNARPRRDTRSRSHTSVALRSLRWATRPAPSNRNHLVGRDRSNRLYSAAKERRSPRATEGFDVPSPRPRATSTRLHQARGVNADAVIAERRGRHHVNLVTSRRARAPAARTKIPRGISHNRGIRRCHEHETRVKKRRGLQQRRRSRNVPPP